MTHLKGEKSRSVSIVPRYLWVQPHCTMSASLTNMLFSVPLIFSVRWVTVQGGWYKFFAKISSDQVKYDMVDSYEKLLDLVVQ